MRENNRTAKIIPSIVPSPEEAVSRFHSMGGELTLFPAFGEDLLTESLAAIRQEEFLRKFPDLHLILILVGLSMVMNICSEMAYSTFCQLQND